MPKYDADRIQEIKRRLQNDLNFKDAPYLLDVIEEMREENERLKARLGKRKEYKKGPLAFLISHLMERKGYTQVAFSEVSGIPLGTVASLCSGVSRTPSSKSLKQLSDAFDLPPSVFIEAAGIEEPTNA